MLKITQLVGDKARDSHLPVPTLRPARRAPFLIILCVLILISQHASGEARPKPEKLSKPAALLLLPSTGSARPGSLLPVCGLLFGGNSKDPLPNMLFDSTKGSGPSPFLSQGKSSLVLSTVWGGCWWVAEGRCHLPLTGSCPSSLSYSLSAHAHSGRFPVHPPPA